MAQKALEFVSVGPSGDDHVLPVERFDPDRDLRDREQLLWTADHDAERARGLRDAGDWTGYAETAAELRATGERRIHDLLRSQAKVNDAVETTERAGAVGQGTVTGPASLDPAAYVEGLRSQVGAARAAALPDDETLRDRLETAMESPDAGTFDAGASAGTTVYPDALREQRDLAIWYTTSAYESRFRAGLYPDLVGATPGPQPDAAFEAVERLLSEVHGEAVSLLRDCYGALAAADWERLESHARRGTSYPHEVRRDMVRVGVRLRQARVHEQRTEERGHESDAFRIGRLEADLHRVARELTMLLGASYRHLFLARQRGLHEEGREAAERARETAFDSLVRDGVDVEVDDLVEEPGAHDGRFVETAGVVDDLRLVADGGYGTRFDILDAYRERRLRVFYPYRNLTRWSLREGALVHCNGEFAASSEYADGDPELQLDAVNIGGNAESSWLDHVAHSLKGAKVFARYPSHANAIWSLEPPAGTGGDAR